MFIPDQNLSNQLFFFGALEKMKHELQSDDSTADTSHLI
jgi:hypothetical protein